MVGSVCTGSVLTRLSLSRRPSDPTPHPVAVGSPPPLCAAARDALHSWGTLAPGARTVPRGSEVAHDGPTPPAPAGVRPCRGAARAESSNQRPVALPTSQRLTGC